MSDRICQALPIFEIYVESATGARLEMHPWFYDEGRQYLGLTRVLPPHTGRGRAHRHPGIEQRTVLLEGASARYRCGGQDGILGTREELAIPAGTPHIDPYNDSDEPITVRTLFSPGPMHVVVLGRTHGQALRDQCVDSQQELTLPHLISVLAERDSCTYAAGLPIGLQRMLLPVAAVLARHRGYRPARGFRGRDRGGQYRQCARDE